VPGEWAWEGLRESKVSAKSYSSKYQIEFLKWKANFGSDASAKILNKRNGSQPKKKRPKGEPSIRGGGVEGLLLALKKGTACDTRTTNRGTPVKIQDKTPAHRWNRRTPRQLA